MKHSETRKILPGAKNSALFLHGIVGTPNHFRQVLPLESKVPANWSVVNVCYPGHGTDVKAFGKSSMRQWSTHARAAFLELAERHENVFIVGHSMGALFALQLALDFPEKIPALFLVAVPLQPWVRFSCAVNSLRLAFHRIREDRPREVAIRNACGLQTTPYLWQYIPWIPRFFELFGEIYRTEKAMGNLKVPCIAWQSKKDDLVRNSAAKVLRKSGVMEVQELPDSTHFYYAPQDLTRVCGTFENHIKKISG